MLELKRDDLFVTKSYINGQWLDGDEHFNVVNPSTGDVIAQVADLGKDGAEKAVAAAKAAFPAWAAKPAKERSAILRKWADLILKHKDDLGKIMTLEQGKPLAEAIGEVAYGAAFVEWFAEEGKRAYGDIIPRPADGTRILAMKQPVGVCAMITPWNFPSAMITRKMPPALAVGCTVVSKPAEATPLSALALAVLAEEAGFPKGVINIVPTDHSSDVGKVFCESKDVKKLSFTGSTKVGKILMKQCAGTVKKLSLELGGNAPFIVFDDADLDKAVDGLIAGKFRNCGQVCIAPNRVFVDAKIYDDFAGKLTAKVKALKAGDGFDSSSDLGPLINDDGFEKVKAHLEDAVSNGAKVLIGGEAHSKGGTFYQPTVLTDMTPEMKIYSEETFGPIAALFKFTDVDEVIKMANDTNYGLASYFYANDLARVWKVSEALEYGMVGVNTGRISNEVAPFGGVKESGFGREGSKYGIDDYLEIKAVHLGGMDE